MRTVNLKHFELLTVPQNKVELTRALTLRTQEMRAFRFGYVRLPQPFSMLSLGVYPKTITNFSDEAVKEFMANSVTPFSMTIRAIQTRKPYFFSDWETDEEQMRFEKFQAAGFSDGVAFPIKGSKSAAFMYFFNRPVEKDWTDNHVDQPMSILANLVDMAITARPELCAPFEVPGLTPRMLSILKHKTNGLTNDQIAVELGVKSDTVKKAIRRFSDRLGGLSTITLIYRLTKMGML